MADDTHFKKGKWLGVFYKYEREVYRKTCKGCSRGYHRNRWDAHHVLPGVTFSSITDDYWLKCLRVTDYDINEDYSMGGLPKLTAFILHFQRKAQAVEYKRKLETTVTMRRWGKVRQYAKDKQFPIDFPGNFPVHNPCNWGHLEYEEDVMTHLNDIVFAPLQKQVPHPPPKNVKKELETAQSTFWGILVAIANGPGGGAHVGIEDNFRNRYGTAKDGWWKPMCMSRRVDEAPSSPSLR
jgi:hypothetical protein